MRVRRPRVIRFLQEAERFQWRSAEEVRRLQWLLLKTVLSSACENVPFYRDWFKSQGMNIRDIVTPADFRRLPILTKEILRSQSVGLRSEISRGKVIENYTGGSTGEPTTFYQDDVYVDWGEALTIRHNRWAGWEFGERTVYLWGADRDLNKTRNSVGRWYSQHFKREVLLNSFDLDGTRLGSFYNEIIHFNPRIIIGYASALTFFARYVHDGGRPWPVKLRGIISAAETLDEYQRTLIESVFQCTVFNRYGSRDMGLMASQCQVGSGLHICADNVYLEVLRPGGEPALPGELGEVVVTGLNNFAMPLIRFAIGDVAAVDEDRTCACGRGLPLLQFVKGRVSDLLVTPAGKFVHGEYFTHLFYGKRWVDRFQVIQDVRDAIGVRIMASAKPDPREIESLRREIVDHLGPEMHVTIEFVDQIPVTPTGKYRFTLSHLPPAAFKGT